MQVIKRTIPISNYMKGREGKQITKIVMHWFGTGDLAGADSRFSNPLSKVSAHYGISDDIVYQWVEEKYTSYGAGDWNTNLTCINIEHDATTTKNATEETYQTAGQLLREICDRHNIPLDREHIIKHSEVKATQCPGTLDVDKIIAIAKGENMSEDIPTSIEEKFGLKEIDRYNKYWTYEELISDWVKMYGELVYNTEEKEKYKKEARDLREVTQSQAESIALLNKEIESLNKAKTDLSFEISQLQAQFAEVSRERDSLTDVCKGYEEAIPKLNAHIKELEGKLISQNPLKTYSSKDLLGEVWNRVVNKFKGGTI